MNKLLKRERKHRPKLIMVLSLWLMISVLWSVEGLVSPTQRTLIYPNGILSLSSSLMMLYIILMAIAAVGYWQMRTWGVITFALYILFGIAHQLIFGLPASLERSVHKIIGSTTNMIALCLLYSALYLVPGYFYIIKRK